MRKFLPLGNPLGSSRRQIVSAQQRNATGSDTCVPHGWKTSATNPVPPQSSCVQQAVIRIDGSN